MCEPDVVSVPTSLLNDEKLKSATATAGDAAFALYVGGLLLFAGTGGFLHVSQMGWMTVEKDVARVADALVTAGLWRSLGDGCYFVGGIEEDGQ